MSEATSNPKRLYLSSTDKKLSGVCGGLGEYLEIDSTVIRVLWIVGTFFTGIIPGLLAYVVAALIIPERPPK